MTPTKEEIQQEMELHNADEAGIDNQWTLEDAEYHLLLSDKYHNTENTRYEVSDLLKFAEVDIFEEGCQPETTVSFMVDCSFVADNPPSLIGKIREFLGMCDESDAEGILINSGDEDGRIDFQLMETDEGVIVDEDHIEEWKAGERKLWAVTYTAQVEKVTRTTEKLEG